MTILFEFTVHAMRYRGVQMKDGKYKLEEREAGSKSFKTLAECASVNDLNRYRSQVERLEHSPSSLVSGNDWADSLPGKSSELPPNSPSK